MSRKLLAALVALSVIAGFGMTATAGAITSGPSDDGPCDGWGFESPDCPYDGGDDDDGDDGPCDGWGFESPDCP